MTTPHSGLSRRELLVSAGTVMAVAVGASPSRAAQPPVFPGGDAPGPGGASSPRRVLRFAHLTDLHSQPEKHAEEGVAACLHHLQSMADPPGLVVTGGDLVFDTFDTDAARAGKLWDGVTRTFRNECSLPVEHALGNHDIFGWNKAKSKTTGSEPGWGKAMALERLGLAKPFHAFARAGWRFLMLDSVQPDGGGYQARLDPEQRAWLEAELTTHANTPTVVVSHVPIISTTIFAPGKDDEHAHRVPWAVMHGDAMDLHELFARTGAVRLALSGHIHRHDRVEMPGVGMPSLSRPVTYICDGAVCGSWWNGRKDRCDEGYGLIDLFEDGTFVHSYVPFGWAAKP